MEWYWTLGVNCGSGGDQEGLEKGMPSISPAEQSPGPAPLQPPARLRGHGLNDHLLSRSLCHTHIDLAFPSGISDSFISPARMSQRAKSQSFHSPGQLPVPSQVKLTSMSLAHPQPPCPPHCLSPHHLQVTSFRKSSLVTTPETPLACDLCLVHLLQDWNQGPGIATSPTD